MSDYNDLLNSLKAAAGSAANIARDIAGSAGEKARDFAGSAGEKAKATARIAKLKLENGGIKYVARSPASARSSTRFTPRSAASTSRARTSAARRSSTCVSLTRSCWPTPP